MAGCGGREGGQEWNTLRGGCPLVGTSIMLALTLVPRSFHFFILALFYVKYFYFTDNILSICLILFESRGGPCWMRDSENRRVHCLDERE